MLHQLKGIAKTKKIAYQGLRNLNSKVYFRNLKVYLFSRFYNHFLSQNCILTLLYVEGAIVTSPYLFKGVFVLLFSMFKNNRIVKNK